MKESRIKEKYSLKNGSYPSLIRMPRELQNIFLNAKKDGLSIHTVRIIASILARIKFSQMTKPEQLSLFSNLFFQEADSLVKFTFLYKDFLPSDYTNIKPLKDSFKFLEDYKNEYHEVTNKKGDKLDVGGGIIMGKPIFNKTKRTVVFYMNSYWYDLFLNISDSFNDHLLELFFKTTSVNTIIFYSWLTTLPKDKYTKNIVPSSPYLKWFNEKFCTNYTSYSELERSCLKKIKMDLDKYGDISFGYCKNKDNKNRIDVQAFDKAIANIPENRPKDIEYSKIKYKIKYLKDKHDLTKEQAQMITLAFKKHGYDKMNWVIKKNKKIWTKEIQGKDFVKRFTIAYTNFLKTVKLQ